VSPIARSFARPTKILQTETFPRCLPRLTPPSRGTFLVNSPLSADYRGHDQIGGFFQRTMDVSGGAFSIDVHNVRADADLVVVLATA
jgi:hypothetical protein